MSNVPYPYEVNWQIGHRKWFLNTNLFLIKPFLITKFDCTYKFQLKTTLALDMDFASFAHGPCWEPTLSHFSIAMSYVTGRSKDSSPPLSWWDKLRFLTHGRLLVSVKVSKFQKQIFLFSFELKTE